MLRGFRTKETVFKPVCTFPARFRRQTLKRRQNLPISAWGLEPPVQTDAKTASKGADSTGVKRKESRLPDVKRRACHLSSGDLFRLASWATDSAGRKVAQEDRKARFAFSNRLKVGDQVALGSFHDPAFDVVSGKTAVVTKIGRTRIHLRYNPQVHSPEQEGRLLWKGRMVPYLLFWLHKGHPALKPVEELKSAHEEAQLNQMLRPVLDLINKEIAPNVST